VEGSTISPVPARGNEARRGIGREALALALFLLMAASIRSPATAAIPNPLARPATPAAVPIEHVVIIDQENHSFDNMLGFLCEDVAAGRIVRPGYASQCDGTTTGTLPDGSSQPFVQSPDFAVKAEHNVAAQARAIDGGRMDGFALNKQCGAGSGYACLSGFGVLQGTCGRTGTDTCIPNLAALAENFTISDRTFEFRATPSWSGHMVLGSATMDGFQGDNPKPSKQTSQRGPGWGCDSFRDTQWWNGSRYIRVPACVPKADGTGPYRPSPVAHVPTIFDRLDDAGDSWRIYGVPDAPGTTPYGWAICPTFADCLLTQQATNFVSLDQFTTDAHSGNLPAFSIVVPRVKQSQHPPASTAVGDNYLGSIIGALETGPEWSSTAIFLTYDDCGCFSDHVNPLEENPEWGVRVPMVVISQWAKQGYTDSGPATFASMLAFTERVFGITPLNPCASSGDPNCSDDVTNGGSRPAYDYWDSFDFSQPPVPPVAMVRTMVPRAEARWLAAHPNAGADET
jgi:phospholipase C